jgi:adenylate cyclase class IV
MKGQFETPEEAREKLYQLAERLGLQKEWQDTKGYPHLLLEEKGRL